MSAVASGGMAPELPPPKPKSSGGCSCDLRGDHGLRTVTDSAAVLILLLVLGGYRRQRQANIA
jgi:MYXO-CTERM domain-containing protein